MRLHRLLLPMAITSTAATRLTPWEEIHQTLHRYPTIIDRKIFSQFDQVFSQNAFANYTGALSSLTGLSAIEKGLADAVTGLRTQHLLGTTVIDITGEMSANSTTYVQATLIPDMGNNVTTLLAYYLDSLERGKEGWRIENRLLVVQGTIMQSNAGPGV